MDNIGDAQSFSDKTLITSSKDFSVKTLTEVTPSWKTELNRSISAVEDRIPRWLQHHHKTCCKKGGLVYFEDDFTIEMLFPDGWTCIHMTNISKTFIVVITPLLIHIHNI